MTVNSVSPGYCKTAMVMAVPEDIRNQIIANIPVGRLGEPREIARVGRFPLRRRRRLHHRREHSGERRLFHGFLIKSYK